MYKHNIDQDICIECIISVQLTEMKEKYMGLSVSSYSKYVDS